MFRCLAALLLLAILAAGKYGVTDAAAAVTATPAYESVFGVPPTAPTGSCFAILGYLPAAAAPSRVRPLAMFGFRRDHLLKQVIGKLLNFDRRIAVRVGVTIPFPAGTRLNSLSQENDLVRIDLRLPPGEGGDPLGMLSSLAHSAEQFPGGTRLLLSLNGKPVPGQPADGYRPSPASVIDPGPPLLLAARLGTSEFSRGQPELALLFDRPVQVSRLALLDAAGGEITGERFLGIFDMAVVIHPQPASPLAVGKRLEVHARVEDRLGRLGLINQQLVIEAGAEP